jgi:hypothetical protein
VARRPFRETVGLESCSGFAPDSIVKNESLDIEKKKI